MIDFFNGISTALNVATAVVTVVAFLILETRITVVTLAVIAVVVTACLYGGVR